MPHPSWLPQLDSLPTLDGKPHKWAGEGLWSRETKTSTFAIDRPTALSYGSCEMKSSLSSLQIPVEAAGNCLCISA